MKKFQLLLVAALIVAGASAFTTKAKTIDEYVLISGTYQLVSSQPPGGECNFQESSTCKYEKIADEGANPYTNPANFSPLDTDQVWVP